jgi:hypothetical protein
MRSGRSEKQVDLPLGAIRAHAPDQRTQSTYLFGAVCPNEGPAPPLCCRPATAKPCSFISTRSPPRTHRARTPFSSSIKPAGTAPRNSGFLPTSHSCHCRRAHPSSISQENIWQFMRQNWLSNRIFKSLDDIVDHCCFAWNTLTDQPWKIMSIAQRDCRSLIVRIRITFNRQLPAGHAKGPVFSTAASVPSASAH